MGRRLTDMQPIKRAGACQLPSSLFYDHNVNLCKYFLTYLDELGIIILSKVCKKGACYED